MNLREMMGLHVATLFTHDRQGNLERVNEPGGDLAPRFFLGLTDVGPVLRFRADVSTTIRDELARGVARLPGDVALPNRPIASGAFQAILARQAPVTRIWLGPAFRFPDSLPRWESVVPVTAKNSALLSPFLHAWADNIAAAQPMVALIADGHAKALCCTVRRTITAHEAGVETAVSARGRGYAGRVAAEWASLVRASGAEPLYSTSWQNTASLAVARKLRLIPIGSDLHMQ